MKEYIALDCHKHYSLAEREEVASGRVVHSRIEHRRGAIREFLADAEPGTVVALEATGNWYWIVQEIEEAKLKAALVHPRKAKLMSGMINKTDKLDVHGFNVLQRNQTLPTVWIPPGELRDQRELTRTRMVLSRQRTRLKNRLHATLSKYALVGCEYSDRFGKAARQELERLLGELPEQTCWSSQLLLEQLDFVTSQLDRHEERLEQILKISPSMQLLRSLPGVGLILSAVMALEIGDVSRFASAQRLASYCGTTPRVSASGGKIRWGKVRDDVNRYLKWALVEAANVVVLNQRRWRSRHVVLLYERLKERKGHAKAIGAVARHLAESAWHVLSRGQKYRDPAMARVARQA